MKRTRRYLIFNSTIGPSSPALLFFVIFIQFFYFIKKKKKLSSARRRRFLVFQLLVSFWHTLKLHFHYILFVHYKHTDASLSLSKKKKKFFCCSSKYAWLHQMIWKGKGSNQEEVLTCFDLFAGTSLKST